MKITIENDTTEAITLGGLDLIIKNINALAQMFETNTVITLKNINVLSIKRDNKDRTMEDVYDDLYDHKVIEISNNIIQ